MLSSKALQRRLICTVLPGPAPARSRCCSTRPLRCAAQAAATRKGSGIPPSDGNGGEGGVADMKQEEAMVGVWEYPAGWNGLFVVGEYEVFRDASSNRLCVLEKQSRDGLRMESKLSKSATSPWYATDIVQGYRCRLRLKADDDRMVSQFREEVKGDWEPEVLAQRKVERSRGQLLFQGVASFSATTLASCWFLGPELGAGAMLLLVTHESGHLLAMSLAGIRPQSISFVPLLGAAIEVDDYNQTAWREGQILLAGPLAGLSLSTTLRLLAEVADHPALFLALANLGFVCELVNLLPLAFLDGARLAPLLGAHALPLVAVIAASVAAVTWHPVPIGLAAVFGIASLRGAAALRRVHRSSSFYEGIETKHLYLLSGGYLWMLLWTSSCLMFLPHSIFSFAPSADE